MSMKSYYFLYLDDEYLVDNWLNIDRDIYFDNPENGLYGYELRFKAIAEYWLQHGCHDPACKEPEILYAQENWDLYMKYFVEYPVY